MNTPKIFADFNNGDRHGRLRLNTNGSLKDIKIQKLELRDGMQVVVSDDDELSAIGEVIFSQEENIWVVKIDWSRIKRQSNS